MKYIYDGMLSNFVAESVKTLTQSYGFVVEIEELPSEWNEWQKTNLVDYVSRDRSGVSGEVTERRTKMYGLVRTGHKHDACFLFFKSEGERAAFVRDFPKLVVNEKPFKTLIE
jgi:hypothetical protein